MAGYYNKDDIKQKLEIEQVFDLFAELGGEPEYTSFGLISQTICHNLPGEGSPKLYYYSNTQLCHCYTGCAEPSFDIFELVIKAMKLQRDLDWELYDAMCFVAAYFGLAESARPETANKLKDWDIFKRYDVESAHYSSFVSLKEYDSSILERFAYPQIYCWEKEGISSETLKANQIGYYAGGEQISIPHFDIQGRLIGIRGRALVDDEAKRWGKYRPLIINKVTYSHPLSMNLYNLNNSKDNIRCSKTAIIFESEKSTLLFSTYYGKENDISVACCGSSLSSYQIELLARLGVREIIVAFDRQFQEIGDTEFIRLKNKLCNIYNKYNNQISVTAIFDKGMITSYKASPIDEGMKKFEKLLNERIIPKE